MLVVVLGGIDCVFFYCSLTLTAFSNYTASNLPLMQNQRLLVQF
jgi:hypothetical protein